MTAEFGESPQLKHNNPLNFKLPTIKKRSEHSLPKFRQTSMDGPSMYQLTGSPPMVKSSSKQSLIVHPTEGQLNYMSKSKLMMQ